MEFYKNEVTLDKNLAIAYLLIVAIITAIACIGISLLDQEPIKERQQVVLIKSIGVWHKYIVDGKSVIVEYEEVE
jgi:hypothetical protein